MCHSFTKKKFFPSSFILQQPGMLGLSTLVYFPAQLCFGVELEVTLMRVISLCRLAALHLLLYFNLYLYLCVYTDLYFSPTLRKPLTKVKSWTISTRQQVLHRLAAWTSRIPHSKYNSQKYNIFSPLKIGNTEIQYSCLYSNYNTGKYNN